MSDTPDLPIYEFRQGETYPRNGPNPHELARAAFNTAAALKHVADILNALGLHKRHELEHHNMNFDGLEPSEAAQVHSLEVSMNMAELQGRRKCRTLRQR